MISPVAGLAAESNATNVHDLAECYGDWSGIRTNQVITENGHFYGHDGSSRSISNPQDLELLLALRRQAQILVVDATTARLEKYRAPAEGIILVLVSRTSNFAGIAAAESKSKNVYLACPERSGNNWIATQQNPWAAIQDFAMESAKPRILAESGPNLTSLAFEAGLVQQSALTITPLQSELTGLNRFHPFDKRAQNLSIAQGPSSTFTLWAH